MVVLVGELATLRLARSLATGIWALAIVVGLGAIVLGLLYPSSLAQATDQAAIVQAFSFLPTFFAAPTVGALVAARRPHNPVGWLLCLSALTIGAGKLAHGYAFLQYCAADVSCGLVAQGTASPHPVPASSIYALWTVGIFLRIGLAAALIAFLLFPSGHAPSPRWRFAVTFVLVAFTLDGALASFVPGSLTIPPGNEGSGVYFPVAVLNPVALAGPVWLLVPLKTVTALFVVLSFPVVAGAFVARYRGSGTVERQQLKWLVYNSGLSVAFLLMSAVFEWVLGPSLASSAFAVLGFFALGFLSVTAGVAILRHHLYDIDLIINRTLVYGALTAILAGLYSASINLFQRLFMSLTGERSDVAVVISTLILAAAFTPVRAGLQGIVDRYVKPAADPKAPRPTEGTELGFVARLRPVVDLLDIKAMTQHALDEAVQTFQATGGAVYLMQQGKLELEARTGDVGHVVAMRSRLEHDGHQYGRIELGPRRDGAGYSPQDQTVLAEIATVLTRAIRLAQVMGVDQPTPSHPSKPPKQARGSSTASRGPRQHLKNLVNRR